MIGYIILGIALFILLCVVRMGGICSEEEDRRPWPGELPEDEGEK
jgi:hypothetical protein